MPHDSPALSIAEIPYESGAVHFRYSRVMSEDGSRWVRHGLFVAYSEGGVVLSEGTYVKGSEEGLWRDFHPNGKLASEGNYRAGLEEGLWRYWAADGSEEHSVFYEKGVERA